MNKMICFTMLTPLLSFFFASVDSLEFVAKSWLNFPLLNFAF
jgi:hypothetical protein